MTEFTRRSMLTSAAALGAAAMAPTGISPASAAAPPAGKQANSFYRYKVGDYEITVVTDGSTTRKLEPGFITNQKIEDVQAALAAAFMDKDQVTIRYSPVVVNTGSKLIVIDTGTGEANYERSKGAAGSIPGQPQGRRHRPQRHRHGGDLAFPRRPHQRTAHRRQQAGLRQGRDSGAGAGVEVFHG